MTKRDDAIIDVLADRIKLFIREEGVSTHPKPWERIDSLKGTHENILYRYFRDNYWIYDSDNSGESIYYCGIAIGSNVEYFKVTHEWYVHNYIENIFLIEETTKNEAKIPMDRDWLQLPYQSNWPPEEIG